MSNKDEILLKCYIIDLKEKSWYESFLTNIPPSTYNFTLNDFEGSFVYSISLQRVRCKNEDMIYIQFLPSSNGGAIDGCLSKWQKFEINIYKLRNM